MTTTAFTDKQRKLEMLVYARQGINDFLKTTRGAAMFGASAKTKIINNIVIQIECHLDETSGPTFFELHLKKPW